MESHDSRAAFHTFIQSTLEQEQAARNLLHDLHSDQPIEEEDVFWIARVLAIAGWKGERVPDILFLPKQRHDLRGGVDHLVTLALCLDDQAEAKIIDKIDSIVRQFNALCERATTNPSLGADSEE